MDKQVDADGDGTFADSENTSAGDDVIHQINVTNTGNETVTLDGFSDGTYTTLTDDDLSKSLVGETLKSGDNRVVTFDGQAPSGDNESKTNTFTVNASDDDGNAVNDSDIATVTTPPGEFIYPCTPGFWDAHNGEYATGNNENLTTDLLPIYLGTEDVGKSVNVSSDEDVRDVFNANLTGDSKKSNGITKLYIHLLAAKFNINADDGARTTDEVDHAINRSDEILVKYNESDWKDIKKNNKTLANEIDDLKDTLDAFNNGKYAEKEPEDWWE